MLCVRFPQLKRNKEDHDGKLKRLRAKLASTHKQIADSIKARDFAAAKAKSKVCFRECRTLDLSHDGDPSCSVSTCVAQPIGLP